MAKHPRARDAVVPVWDRLTELERAGHDPGVIAALRFVLIHHQPSALTGRCLTCRRRPGRLIWRRRTWPCVVWKQVRAELLGLTSIEIDALVAELARTNLATSGYTPTVITGDGAAGYPASAPYDRVIATASVRPGELPYAWVNQTRPGGIIVTPWGSSA